MSTVHMETGNGYLTVELSGELDIAAIEPIRDRLRHLAGAVCGVLILDLARVTFLDSTALGMFCDMHRRAAESGTLLVLINLDPQVGKPIRLTALDTVLNVHYAEPEPTDLHAVTE